MKARHCAGPSYLIAFKSKFVTDTSDLPSDAARKMAAAVEAEKAAGKYARDGLSVCSDDAAAGGGDDDRNDDHADVAGDRGGNDGRADEVDDGGGNDEASGAADRAGCLHDDSVDDGLRYGSRVHACGAPARACRPPRYLP
jgi:hypothetical protein